MKTYAMLIPLIIFLIILASGNIGYTAHPPEKMEKIRIERIQLEINKKKAFKQCEKRSRDRDWKGSDKCMKSVRAKHEAEVHLLMKAPDMYFAQKQKRQKNIK